MGNLHLSMYDAVSVVLSGELGLLSDSVDESCWRGGLSASNSSGVTGGAGASQGVEFLWHDTSTGERG